MENLTARFSAADEMSDKIARIAEAGLDMAEQLEQAGASASQSFDGMSSGVVSAARAADGVATSITAAADSMDSYGSAAESAAASADNWTAAIGNYDKELLEALYSTEELVEMGFKTADALAEQEEMFARCEQAAENLSKGLEATGEAQGTLSAAMDKASEAAEALANSESLSAEAKEALSRASEGAAEAMSELMAAQENAAAAMEEYDNIIMSGTTDLDALEGAAQRAAEAADTLAAANGKASDAAEELAKATEQATEEAEKGGKKGVDAAETVASALAAAGITATVKEITESVYELVDAFSEAESTVVKATGASGEALDGLMESTMNAYAAAKSADLGTTASAIGEINTRMGLTGDKLTTVTGQFLDFAEITGTDVVGSVQSATKIMNKWGVDAGNVESVLDKLAYAGQVSGISVSSLSDTVTNSSATFQTLGLNLDNTISLLADLELYGTSSTTTVTGLRTAVNNFSKDGLDAEEALRDVIEQIANMEDASEATALAVDTFGSRAGQELAGAIRSGAISVDSLSNSLDVAKGTLSGTAATAQTLEQKWTQASNNISAAFTSAVEPTLSAVSGGLANVANGTGTFLNDHPIITKAIVAIGVGLGSVSIAFAAVSAAVGIYNAITIVSTAVTAAFGVTLSAAIWPITAIVAGIAAVVAIASTLINIFSAAEDETEGMTAVTRNQYYELQDLNAEYEEACEKYGETSEEASRLKYQLDDLNAAFEANQQTVEEFTAEVDALCESVHSVTDSFNSAMAEINANEVGSLSLIQKYEDLASKADRTAAEEKALAAVTKQLSTSYPELAQRMGSATMSTEDYVAAMKKAAEAEAEAQRQQQAQDTYIEALQKRAELEEEIAKATANVNAEQERMDDMSGWEHFWTGGEWEDLEAYQAALEELNAAQAENEATIAQIEQGWEDLATSEAEAANAIVGYEDAVETALSSVQEDIDELCAAYDEAYESARSSIDGQIGLFDTMATETELSITDMQAAFDSQIAYLNTYSENLRKAAEYGLDEGLVASLSDGSEESAGYLNAIIENIEALGASSTEAQAFVDDFNSSFQEVEAAKDEFATTVATMETDFDEKMAEIEGRLDEAIDNMNMEADAAAAAKETMDAYTQSIRDGTSNAVSAAESAAKAVSAALSTSYSGGTVTTVTGHASGTTNAEDAFIAGEDGPELIIGKAGSTVFPADETDRIINAVTNNDNRVTSYALSNPDTNAGDLGGGSEEQTKHITLEIGGGSPIEVSGGSGASKEEVVEILLANLRPALLNIVKDEIFEEGDSSYEH